jgi:predicted molibdopterin-dependent oxidoreductase YjgC
MGLHPWGSSSERTHGSSAAEMLEAAAAGRINFLWIMGADLVSDFPDAKLVDRALASDVFYVVSELFPTDTARSADVILPAASMAEKEGSVTNLERRIQKVAPSVPPPGVARSDWWTFADLAARFGRDWGWTTPAAVAQSIAQNLPTHSDFSWERIEPPPLPRPRAGTRPGANAWPLSWELRAVDATRRKGWIPSLDAPSFSPAAGSRPELGLNASSPETRKAPETSGNSPSLSLARSIPAAPPAQGNADSLNYPLVLLVGRALFDNGGMVSRSSELAAVTPAPFVELHPEEVERRGLSEGQSVTVASPRGSVRVRLKVSTDTPVGAAFMLFDQPGVRANVLMEFGAHDRVEVRT